MIKKVRPPAYAKGMYLPRHFTVTDLAQIEAFVDAAQSADAFHQDSEWLRAFVTRLTRRHEGGRDHPWAISDAPPEYIDGQLRAIVGVELTITSIEAKQKLSQNRSELDREGVVAGLRREPGPGPAAIADVMAVHFTGGASES